MTGVVTPPTAIETASRPGLVIAALGFCAGLVSITQTMALPLLAQLPDQLHSSVGDVSWVATSTLLAGAVSNPVLGRLGDMYGKRRLLLISMLALVLGSAVAALASDLPVLVLGRTLQGFSVGVIPLGISIARDALPARRVNGGIALVSATLGIGSGLGLPLAGLLLGAFDWHVLFWVSCALSVVGWLLARAWLPESGVHSRGPFDVLGAVWLSVLLVLVLLPVSKAPSWGWVRPLPLAMFLTAIVGGALWVRYESRCPAPVVDVRVMRRRTVVLANLAGLLLGFGMFANVFVSIQLLQLSRAVKHGFGASTSLAGVVLLPGALAMVLTSPVSATITTRFGGRRSLLTGSLVVALSYGIRPFLLGSLFAVGLGVTLVNLGVGIAYGALPAVIMADVPRSDTGSANSVNALARVTGASLGSAGVAAALGSITVVVAGTRYPGLAAFRLILVMAAVGALLAAGVAYLLPRRS